MEFSKWKVRYSVRKWWKKSNKKDKNETEKNTLCYHIKIILNLHLYAMSWILRPKYILQLCNTTYLTYKHVGELYSIKKKWKTTLCYHIKRILKKSVSGPFKSFHSWMGHLLSLPEREKRGNWYQLTTFLKSYILVICIFWSIWNV